MNISVLTPDKKIFEGAIVSVKVPGTNGEFKVLKRHAPIVSSLESGKVTIVSTDGNHQYFNSEDGEVLTENLKGKTYTFQIDGGFIEVLKDEVSLLVQGVKEGKVE